MSQIVKLKKNGVEVNPIGIQTVENANGTAIKFPDGIMICHDKKDMACTFSAFEGTYRADITNPFVFPIPFVSKPTINISTASDKDYYYASIYGVIRNATGISKISVIRPASATNGTMPLQYIAIGRWK